MDTIDKVLGFEKTFELSEIEVPEDSSKKSKENTSPVKRIPNEDLEQMYILNPVISSGVDTRVQLFMSAGYTFGNRAVDKKWAKWAEEVKFGEYVRQTFQHTCVYGKAWGELVPNKQGNKIVALIDIDPKTMDYQKSSDGGHILLDGVGNPVGYTQKVEDNGVEELIKFTTDEIAHFTYKTVGARFNGIGMIENEYKTGINKLNIEEGFAQSIYRHGFPLIVASTGDVNHEPTPQKIQNILKKIQGVNYKSEIAVPYYTTLAMLEAKKASKLDIPLNYLIDQEITGMQLPGALVKGSGEDVNRATLSTQTYLLEQKITAQHIKFANQSLAQIFVRVNEMNNMGGLPNFSFNPVNIEDLNSVSERLNKYVTSGLIDPADKGIRDYVRLIEDLPVELKYTLDTKEKEVKPDKKVDDESKD